VGDRGVPAGLRGGSLGAGKWATVPKYGPLGSPISLRSVSMQPMRHALADCSEASRWPAPNIEQIGGNARVARDSQANEQTPNST
jgi:hypothetical protein